MASEVATDRIGGPGFPPGLAETSLGGRVAGRLRSPLLGAVVRRLLLAVPVLFVVSALTFVLVSFSPGDAANQILGPDAPPEAYERLRHELGLDLPLYEQYWRWLEQTLGGDLGTSLFSGESAANAINARASVTLFLIVCSLLVVVVVGVGLGIFSAVRGGALGRFVDGLALLGFALPAYWVGAVLIAVFAVKLGLFPAVGYVPLAESPVDWARSLVLPVTALALHGVAAVAKQTREAMLDVLASEHVRMVLANGIPSRSILFVYALKNAAIRVVTILGLQTVGLLGGTVLVEHVFGLPGLGGLAVSASLQHDLPVIQALAICFTVIVVLVNLAIDLAYVALNPRVRAQ